MCGDHPSFTKTELNVKEVKSEDKDKPREGAPIAYARISPTSSRSEHETRALQTRRPVLARSLEAVRTDAPNDRALLQAAMGSFRWPPYLLCVWVLVLVLTHVLHCVAAVLERALPPLKKLCQYFRNWTEESWRAETDMNQRVYPIIFACVTGSLYALYGVLYAVYAAALWAIEPLCPDDATLQDVLNVTNYTDDPSNTDASLKR
ncbi:unnamed protein product [Diatraea saccharalis]|uniref:Transmembrane protein n=1 Tax=Diatraea saccharalis TaxID=40085 RepID=A0A9N9R468_9NEOP|nr:unnamed protein product [Diatraea saccharalis]